ARISKNKDLENNNQIDDGVLYFKFEKEKRSYTEIAAMYKVLTVTDVKDRIKKYAKKYGLPVNEEINELDIKVERAKIEKVSEQDEIKNSKLYSLHRDHKMNSTEIASLYDITADEIDKKLTSYALRNNLEYPINFAKEYHEAETEGLTREQIADKFNVSPRTVRDEITKYCEENNLETKETKFKNNILGIMKSNTNENKEISSTGVEKLTNEIATEQPGIIAVAIIDLAGLREHQRD
ncbi:MAG: helix-turn-helix domain-containing protein, partial [Lachnospiraceae bacterium]|nr:helix-turn-helix domain-containing protein [Lachnospiraceae bacterium]